MNGYDRIMAAIQGKPVDRTPVWPFVMMFAARYSGTPQQIQEETAGILSAGYPRFILSPGCEVGRDTPAENLHTFVNSAKQG